MRNRILFAALLATGLAQTARAQPVLELRPNLTALPAFQISVQNDLLGRPELRFSVTTANLGEGPLEFRGGEKGSGKQNVYQRVYLDNGSYYDHLAGSFVWHPEHNHIHLEGYATYTLQQVGAPGSSRRTSEKTSFCVIDTDRIDHRLPGSSKKPVYETCESEIQGLSVGWGDTYGSHLPGQSILLTDLPGGDYTLTIEADANGRFIETTSSDNVACVLLRIGVSPLSLEVLNASGCDYPQEPPPAGVTLSRITPDFGSVGALVPVVIEGSGFTAGAAVSFENGSGSRLAVSDVVVIDSGRISALVTIRRRGQGNDNVWDLRVDGAVLPDAFVVYP